MEKFSFFVISGFFINKINNMNNADDRRIAKINIDVQPKYFVLYPNIIGEMTLDNNNKILNTERYFIAFSFVYVFLIDVNVQIMPKPSPIPEIILPIPKMIGFLSQFIVIKRPKMYMLIPTIEIFLIP